MSYITYILLLTIGACVLDQLATKPRTQQVIYYVTLVVVWFMLSIRYYYGPDIYNYVPFYQQLHSWDWYLQHSDNYPYEHGFVLFCAVLKGLGIGYYGMTVVVTTLYLLAVAWLFKDIRRHQVLALMLLLVFDRDLIVVQHRQCMCLAFFIPMVICLNKRHYVWALVFSLLAVSMHKSGIFFVSLTWLFYMLHTQRLENGFFVLMFALLCLVRIVPLSSVSSLMPHLDNLLPLSESYIKSLRLHTELGTTAQGVWVFYAMLVLFIEYYIQHSSYSDRGTEAVAILGILLIASCYQFFFLLNRMRSCFLPVLLFYLFRVVQDAEDRATVSENVFSGEWQPVVKKICVALLMLYCFRHVYNVEMDIQQQRCRHYTPQGKTAYSTCTIFDLRHHSASSVQRERLYIAGCYWSYDFMQENSTRLKQ